MIENIFNNLNILNQKSSLFDIFLIKNDFYICIKKKMSSRRILKQAAKAPSRGSTLNFNQFQNYVASNPGGRNVSLGAGAAAGASSIPPTVTGSEKWKGKEPVAAASAASAASAGRLISPEEREEMLSGKGAAVRPSFGIMKTVSTGRTEQPYYSGVSTQTVSGPAIDLSWMKKFDEDESRKNYQKYLQSLRQVESSIPEAMIESVKFGIYTSDDINQIAVMEMTNPNSEGPGSVNDLRLGIIGRGICPTCQRGAEGCPGHFGKISLPFAMVNPFFIRQVISVLNSVCNSCGGLLLSREQINTLNIQRFPPEKRLRIIETVSKKGKCQNSGGIGIEETVIIDGQPVKITSKNCESNPIFAAKASNENITIMIQIGQNEYSPMDVKNIIEIFERISPEDAALLGFEGDSHPRNFLIYSRNSMKDITGGFWPILPPQARYPTEYNGIMTNHPYTYQYISLFREIQKISVNEKSKTRKINYDPKIPENEQTKEVIDWMKKIRLIVRNFGLDDNSVSGKRKNKVVSLKTELTGRHGIIRENIMGKRVNNTGRSVIGPDPNIRSYQIMIPLVLASKMNRRERVTNENYEYMVSLLRKGHIVYLYPKGNLEHRVNITPDNQGYRILNIGDIVYRWLQNGDYIIYNRQPTLHRQGFMSAEIVIVDNESGIRIPLSVTHPYNADFDGDEINLHHPLTEESHREMITLMAVPECIRNAQKNKLMIGLTYNSIIAGHLLTKINPDIPQDEWNDYIMYFFETKQLDTLSQRLTKHGIKPLTGRALISAMFPENFFYRRKDTIIEDGILVSGILNSGNIGLSDGSIPDNIFIQYGSKSFIDYIDTFQRIGNEWLYRYGFTVSIRDCLPLSKPLQMAADIEINKLLQEAKTLEHPLEDPDADIRRKNKLDDILNKVRNISGKIAIQGLPQQKSIIQYLGKIISQPDKPIPPGLIILVDQLISRNVLTYDDRREYLKLEQVSLDERQQLATKLQRQLKQIPISGVDDFNNLKMMVDSGAKGSMSNISQIRSIIGQSIGRLPTPNVITNGQRCSIYAESGDMDIEAWGFCANSYYAGVSPQQLTFLTDIARQDMLAQQLDVPQVGALRRNVMKSFEDLKINHDGTVRNSLNQIIQFAYGADGLDPARLQMETLGPENIPWFIKIESVINKLHSSLI